MTDINETPQYSAEYAALSHEIYNLTQLLEAKEREYRASTKVDVYDPFKNPTEYHYYNDDYSQVLPWVTMPEFSISLEPAKVERKALKRYYSIGGFTVLFSFLGANILAIILMTVVTALLSVANPGASAEAISQYMDRGAIFVSINMLIYLICNVLFGFVGLKWAKISPSTLIRTRDFNFGAAVQYCLAGVFIWMAAGYISSGIEDIFSQYGFTTETMDMDYGNTGLGFAIMTIYSCLIAPVTEEIFYRGMVMKVFAKANQRFAIIASAVFFGLGHGNIPQFMLAFLIGVFMGHIDMKHNSIVPSVIVHIFINSMVTLLSLADGSTEVIIMANLLLLAAMVVGLIMLIFFRKENKLPTPTPAQARRGFAVAKTSIGVLLAFFLQLFYLILLIMMTKT